jgi:hypothetical protein
MEKIVTNPWGMFTLGVLIGIIVTFLIGRLIAVFWRKDPTDVRFLWWMLITFVVVSGIAWVISYCNLLLVAESAKLTSHCPKG